ncbi:hypothetical protein BKA61DRAFT_194907 [Leptodontidium sp. MPI-SDFR-AT-0119]|nr:hypothetical protein BKA61DRAFT_194907 [Leptodontidium sp. MPI-SDFR-AT-0119]
MAIMSDDKEPASTSTPLPKYSRYRRQTIKPEPEPQPVPVQKPDNDFSRSKSMSRYRRSVVPAKAAQIADSSNPPVPTLPRAQNTIGAEGRNVIRRVTEPVNNVQAEERNGENSGRSQGRYRETEEERMRRKVKEFQEREEQQRRVQQAKAEQERLRQQRREEEELQRMAEEEPERLLAEQKRKDLERLQAELDAAPPPLMPVVSPKKEKFGFFSRKRAATKTTPPTTSGSGSGTNSMSKSRSNEPPRSTEVPRSTDIPRGIEQGGGGIVPQTDAPISASNAGERRVLIRCKQSSINLPITPETTPVDIIYSSANIMSQNIIPSTAILLESYTQLGLERRVRRHEHIRDIMNSWDRDTQNALLLINSDSPNFDKDLEASSVPKEAPGNVTVVMYHSQKPGKWSKRHVTLLSSGQMYASKKAGAKMSDKDVLSICHLSDFDIYTPTPQQTRKVLKPPKKHCYAVKSQQKTTMFLSTENFVHFFSSDDLSLAEKFYDAVQSWRSWYLVNKMGEGKKTEGKKVMEIVDRRPGTRGGHAVKVSVDENPYTIGSFQPLMDLNRFNTGEVEYDSEEENMPRQIPFHLRNSVSLSPLPSTRESRRHPPPVAYKLPPEAEDEFASSGLLGRTYSQRLKLQREREEKQGPFVEGPSLLNGSGHQRTLSMKSVKTGRRPQTAGVAGGGSDLHRGLSQNIPKPLLDFTPHFQEAPQWDRKGKGHGVAPLEGVPLVEIATTPESGMADIPRTGTVFRRDARPATSSGAFVKGGLVGGGGGTMNRGRVNYD